MSPSPWPLHPRLRDLASVDPLLGASLLYLFLPIALFVGGWLQPLLAVPLLVILAAALACTLGDASAPLAGHMGASADLDTPEPASDTRPLGWHGFLFVALVALAWTAVSGVGGYGAQTWDHEKHNAILRDLMLYPWPVTYFPYAEDGPTLALVYYFAYYLPAGLVGKLLGWSAANHALFVWTVLGVLLALLWYVRLAGARPLVAAPLFVLFSGADFLTRIVASRTIPDPLRTSEWALSYVWQYSTTTSLLLWVPQHLLGASIVTALLLDGARRGYAGRSAVFLLSAAPLWSVFGALGLAPFVALLAWNARLPRLLSFQNVVAGPLLLLVSGLLFLTRNIPISQGFVWQVADLTVVWPILLAFWSFEFGLFVLLCWPSARLSAPPDRRWVLVMVGLLLALPFYWIGTFNDLGMRASVPALFVLAVLVGRFLWSESLRQWRTRRAAVALLLVIGFATPLSLLNRMLPLYKFGPPSIDVVGSAVHLEGIRTQYVGSRETPFFQILARQTQHVPNARSVASAIARARESLGLPRPGVAFVPAPPLRDFDNRRYWLQQDDVSVKLLNGEPGTESPQDIYSAQIVVSQTAPHSAPGADDPFAADLRDPASTWSRQTQRPYVEFARVPLSDGSEVVVYVRGARAPAASSAPPTEAGG